MLAGARSAGFSVAGNVEWRKYYHATDEHGRSTFKANFPDALMRHSKDELTPQEIERLMNADIALGHPECGNFSQLNANRDAVNDPGDIPLFCDLVGQFKPRFFVMDDLPKSFIAFPMSEYAARLPDYDLFPEWVSNWGYGNVQRARNRFFMLGSLKRERWAFIPGEKRHDKTVADVIGDLEGMEGNFPNHDRHALEDNCAKGLHLRHHGHRATWKDMRDYILNEVKEGGPIHYFGPDGSEKIRVGSYKGHWHGPAHVLTGGISGFHPLKGVPYSIRERARIQGFPDDFEFYGTVLGRERGHPVWNHDKNMHMVRQTGKAMPLQFCTYVSAQVRAHIEGQDWFDDERCTNTRVIQPNEYVDQAKEWYCENVGYANQERACQACQLAPGCEIRKARYNVLPPSFSRIDSAPTRSRPMARPAASLRDAGKRPLEASDSPDPKTKRSKNNRLTPNSDPRVVLKGNDQGAKSKEGGRQRRHPPAVVPTVPMEFD